LVRDFIDLGTEISRRRGRREKPVPRRHGDRKKWWKGETILKSAGRGGLESVQLPFNRKTEKIFFSASESLQEKSEKKTKAGGGLGEKETQKKIQTDACMSRGKKRMKKHGKKAVLWENQGGGEVVLNAIVSRLHKNAGRRGERKEVGELVSSWVWRRDRRGEEGGGQGAARTSNASKSSQYLLGKIEENGGGLPGVQMRVHEWTDEKKRGELKIACPRYNKQGGRS